MILKEGDVIHMAFPSTSEETNNEVNQQLMTYYGQLGIVLGAISFISGITCPVVISAVRHE